MAPAALRQIVQQRKQNLDISIPLSESEEIALELEKKRLFTGSFRVTQQSASEALPKTDYKPGVYYHGQVAGHPNSLVAISFFDDKVMGVISYNGQNYNLGIQADAEKTADDVYILFSESDLLIPNEFICHTPDEPMDIPADLGASPIESVTNNSVKVYFECDYQMYLHNGSSVSNTTDFVTGMFNVVAAVYDIDDICVELSEVFVWTVQDPYPSSSSDAALDAFQAQLNGNFNGDIAHLLSTVNAGNGGLAYVDVICSSSIGIAYSNISNNYNNLPAYSWTVNVVAHEMGHNLGSPHTHSCNWPGGALDNCFCPEGSCSPGPEPGSGGGTVMSYCHLTGSSSYGNCDLPGYPNPGINLSLGFGSVPGTLIFNNVENSSCLTACGSGGGGGGGSALDCSGAVELLNGETYYGNTDNGSANITTYGCVDYNETGNEVVHFFTAPVDGEALIEYNEDVPGYIDLFVLSACNPNSCLLYFDGDTGVTGTLSVNAGVTYYFVADVYEGDQGGAYDLTISFPDGACQCDNPDALTCDNLESYTPGLLGTQSVCWTTWSGAQGGAEEGIVSTDQAFSGSHAMRISGTAGGGPQDVVFLTGNYNAGHYQLSFKLYVPSGNAAYYNVQHQFVAGSTYQWASEVFFNSDGSGSLSAGGANAAAFDYDQSTWIDVVQDIDIDNDQTTLTINGNAVHTWPFSYQSNTTNGGINALAALDFYPLEDNYLYYIDDIELMEAGSPTAFLTLSPTSQDVDAAAGSTTLSVNANIDWAVSDDADWLTLSPGNANGNGTITADFDDNPTTNTRTATIALTGSGITQTATITQVGMATPFMTISPSSQNVGATVGNTTLSVNANIDWTINDDADWLTLSPDNANGNETITADFDDNPTTSTRVATVTLTGQGITQTATITQAGMQVPFMTLSPANQDVDPASGTVSYVVSSNIDWTVVDDADWLTLSPANANGNGALTADFDDNPTTSTRVATITLTGSGITQTATLTQQGQAPPAIEVSFSVTNESCYDHEDAAIDLVVTGGLPGYTYSWNNGATTEDLANISGGLFHCTITDSNGNTQTSGTIQVGYAPEMIANVEPPDTLSCNQPTVLIDADSSILAPGVSVNWTTPDGNIWSGANTLTPVVDAPGDYTLTLMYNNNADCTASETVTIIELPALDGSISSTPEIGQAADGTATVTVSGGTPPYSYSWNTMPEQTTAVATGLAAGSYAVLVSDHTGCLLLLTVEVGNVVQTNELPGLSQFELFPNPTSGNVNVLLRFDDVRQFQLGVYDVLGREVMRRQLEGQQLNQNIDLSDMPNGVYWVAVEEGLLKAVRRVVVVR